MLEQLQKELAKRGILLTESTLSMALGAVVVVLVAFLAFNYFRANSTRNPVEPGLPEVSEELNGELNTAGTAVALPTTHTVAASEHLWGIAERYFRSGYNYVDIVAANQITSPSHIEPGQKLTIPKVAVRMPLTVAAQLAPDIVDSKITGTGYTVVKGDTLWAIALRAYGDPYRYSELATANKIADPNVIEVGQKFSIPR